MLEWVNQLPVHPYVGQGCRAQGEMTSPWYTWSSLSVHVTAVLVNPCYSCSGGSAIRLNNTSPVSGLVFETGIFCTQLQYLFYPLYIQILIYSLYFVKSMQIKYVYLCIIYIYIYVH